MNVYANVLAGFAMNIYANVHAGGAYWFADTKIL